MSAASPPPSVPRAARVHAHSPAGLRLALLNISERSAEKRRAEGEVGGDAAGEDNVVISHPPRSVQSGSCDAAVGEGLAAQPGLASGSRLGRVSG